jgi:3-oxoacyl-[acyl-carrier-protein] synthase I
MSAAGAVSIVGFAGCTSLGYTLPQTLAAMGAGLSNFSNTGLKNDFGGAVSAASLLERDTPSHERLAALARIGLAGVQELLATVGVAHAPLMLGVASDLADEEAATLRAEVRRSPVVKPEAAWYPYGRASTFVALAQAEALIARGAHRFIVVGGVDSLCAISRIDALVDAERVLGPHTEGTIPGEAAVFALLAKTEDPAVDPATSVLLEAVAQHRGQPFTRAERVSGDDLAVVFKSFRDGGSQRVDRVIAAHSGEGYFGRSFSHAYLREVDVMPEPLEVELIADCTGDVGAAAGPLGLAFAMYRMVNAPREGRGRALVYSESDTGELGAAIIDGAPTSWDRLGAA